MKQKRKQAEPEKPKIVYQPIQADKGSHERWIHLGRPQKWWERYDGEEICGTCHPRPST